MERPDPDAEAFGAATLQLAPELHGQVIAMAAALGRTPSSVVEQAVSEFIAFEARQMAAIGEGIAAADAGQVVAHEDVVAWVRSLGHPDERPMPECG